MYRCTAIQQQNPGPVPQGECSYFLNRVEPIGLILDLPDWRDTLNFMPDDVIEKILSFLPIIQVYAISKFSERFRDAWKLCSDVFLDEEKFQKAELMEVITSDIISGHPGFNARRFELRLNATGRDDIVNTWIERVVNDLGFEEICIDFSPSREILVLKDGTLVFSNKLRSLNLSKCIPKFRLVPSNSFPHLLDITLQGIAIGQELVESIFISCNSLQVLKLISCSNQGNVCFNAQSLQALREIVFENCSLFTHSIHIDAPSMNSLQFTYRLVQTQFNLYEPFMLLGDTNAIRDCIAHCESLINDGALSNEIWTSTCSLLTPSLYSTGAFLPDLNFLIPTDNLFWNVKEVNLCVPPKSGIHLLEIPFLILRCPMVKRVFLKLAADTVQDRFIFITQHLEKRVRLAKETPIKFKHLTEVKMSGVKFSSSVHMILVDFFMVMSTTELRSLIIVKAKGHEDDSWDDHPEWVHLKTDTNAAGIIYYEED